MKASLAFILFVLCGTSFFMLTEGLTQTSKTVSPTNNVSAGTSPLTLSDCYDLALKQSETIAINAELIKETEARLLQGFGQLLPHVSFSYSAGFQDSPSYSPNTSSEAKFVFKQTLFSGFKEFIAISGSHTEKSQRINEKVRAEQLLFVDVADVFYLLLEEREDLKILEAIKVVLTDRIADLKQREKLGRSRQSEVVSIEVQLYNTEADQESMKRQESLARQLLEFLIGKPVGEIADPENSLPFLNQETYYESKAGLRPDLLAARDAWEVSKKKVDIAKSGFLPTVTLESNYYLRRAADPTDTSWDLLFTIDVPLFQGTETHGLVNEQVIKARESELEYQRTGRTVLQDIHDSYVKIESSLRMVDTLKKALNAAEINYKLQKQDYRLNLVNNLDVLQAIRTLEETRRSYVQTFYEAKRFYWYLQAAVGETIRGK